jgi:hypothetical protein
LNSYAGSVDLSPNQSQKSKNPSRCATRVQQERWQTARGLDASNPSGPYRVIEILAGRWGSVGQLCAASSLIGDPQVNRGCLGHLLKSLQRLVSYR